MVITATQLLKGQNLQGDHRANTTPWLRDVDALQKTGEETRWAFIRLLMRAQNLSWKRHPTISEIYNQLPRVSCLVKSRRVQFAGHCYRADGEVISSLLLWRADYGQRRGRSLSFPDVISRDTDIRTEDLGTAMQDMNFWSGFVQSMIATAVE